MILFFFVFFIIFRFFLFYNSNFFNISHKKKIILGGTKLNTFQYIFQKFVPSFLNSTLEEFYYDFGKIYINEHKYDHSLSKTYFIFILI